MIFFVHKTSLNFLLDLKPIYLYLIQILKPLSIVKSRKKLQGNKMINKIMLNFGNSNNLFESWPKSQTCN